MVMRARLVSLEESLRRRKKPLEEAEAAYQAALGKARPYIKEDRIDLAAAMETLSDEELQLLGIGQEAITGARQGVRRYKGYMEQVGPYLTETGEIDVARAVRELGAVGAKEYLENLGYTDASARVMAEPSVQAVLPEQLEVADLTATLKKVYPHKFLPGFSYGIPEAKWPEMAWQQAVERARSDPEGFFQDLLTVEDKQAVEQLLTFMGGDPDLIKEFLYPLAREPSEVENLMAKIPFIRDYTLEELSTLIDTDYPKFVDILRTGGRTSDKQALLISLGASWETINEIFSVQKLVVPVDGIRKLVTITDGKAYDETGRWVGTYNTITGAFEGLPSLGWLDKVKELQSNPTKLVPFVSSGVEVVTLGILLKAAKDLEDGKEVSSGDLLALKEYVGRAQRDTDWGYKVADVLANLVPFAGEFLLTGGVYALGQKAAVKGSVEALKKLTTKTGVKLLDKKLVQLGVKGVGVVAGGTLRAFPIGATRVPASTLEKQLQGNLTGDEQEIWESLVKAAGENWVEVVSESTGGLFGVLSAPVKGQIVKLGLFQAFLKANPLKKANDVSKILGKMGYHGVLGEMLEERVADVGHGILEAVGLGDQRFSLPSLEQLSVELVSFSIPGVASKLVEVTPSLEKRFKAVLATGERGAVGPFEKGEVPVPEAVTPTTEAAGQLLSSPPRNTPYREVRVNLPKQQVLAEFEADLAELRARLPGENAVNASLTQQAIEVIQSNIRRVKASTGDTVAVRRYQPVATSTPEAEAAKAKPPVKAAPGITPLPEGWQMKVGKTRTKEGVTAEAEVDWSGKKIIWFRDEESMANPLIVNHEIAHIVIEELPDAKLKGLLDTYAELKAPGWKAEGYEAEWVIKNKFHQEEIAIDYGQYLTDASQLKPEIKAFFDKELPLAGVKPPVEAKEVSDIWASMTGYQKLKLTKNIQGKNLQAAAGKPWAELTEAEKTAIGPELRKAVPKVEARPPSGAKPEGVAMPGVEATPQEKALEAKYPGKAIQFYGQEGYRITGDAFDEVTGKTITVKAATKVEAQRLLDVELAKVKPPVTGVPEAEAVTVKSIADKIINRQTLTLEEEQFRFNNAEAVENQLKLEQGRQAAEEAKAKLKKEPLANQMRQIHSSLETDITTARQRLARLRIPEGGLVRLALRDASRLLNRAKTLVNRIEQGQEISEEEVNALRDKIQSLKDFYGYEKRTAEEVKQKLVDYIKTFLPLPRQGELLVKVKNVKTEEQLTEAIARVDVIAEAYAEKTLRADIIRELKKTAPRIEKGITVGKLTPEIQRVVEKLRAGLLVGLRKAEGGIARNIEAYEEARAKIEQNIVAYRDGKITQDAMLEANEELKYVGMYGMSSDQLQEALDYIQALRQLGRDFRAIKREEIKAHRQEVVDKAVTEITGGEGIKPGVGTLPERDLAGKKKVLDQPVNSQYGLGNLLDKLGKFAKGAKQNKGFLSVTFNRLVQKATNTENSQREATFKIVKDKVREIYNVLKIRDATRLLTTLCNEKVDLGTFKIISEEGVKYLPFKFTRAEMMEIYQLYKNPKNLETFRDGMHWPQEVLIKIVNTLTEQDIAYADWLQNEFYDTYFDRINPFYQQEYNIDMPRNPDYVPQSRDFDVGETDEVQMLFKDQQRYASVTNKSLKARKENIRPFKLKGVFTVLTNHIVQMEHFMAWVDTMHELRSTFGNDGVRTAIRQYHSQDVLSRLDDYINDFARGGVDRAQFLNFLDKLRRNFTIAVLAIKPSIGIQQIWTVGAFMTEMKARDFVTGMADFWHHPIENYKWMMENSLYIRNRYTGGNYERDIRLTHQTDVDKTMSGAHNFSQWLLWQVTQGDKFGVMPGWWAKYKAGLKEGLSQEDAMLDADITSERTQNTSELASLSWLQRGSSWGKLLTMYQSQPNKYFRIVAENIRNMQYGRQSKIKGITNLFIVWALLPMLFQFVGDALQWKKERQARALVLGPLNNILVVGQLIQAAWGWFTDDNYDWQVSPVLSTVRDFQNFSSKLWKIKGQIEDPYKDVAVDDIVAALEFFSKGLGQLVGAPTPYLIMVERAINDGDPRELVFSRWALEEPKPELRGQTARLIGQLGQVIEDVTDLPVDKKPPVFTTAKAFAEVKKALSKTLPQDVTEKNGFSPQVVAIAQALMAQDILETLPNKRLFEIIDGILDDNTLNYTFSQYYMDYQDRLKITSLAKLKEWDANHPRFNFGNVTPDQYKLMKQYEALDTKVEKVQFRKEHLGINTNPHDEWLKIHPKENALLGVWGETKLLTKAALVEAKRLVEKLDIPDSAIPEFTLPPEETFENYASYKAVEPNSWEAQLILAKDEELRKFLERDPIETPVAALDLKVKHRKEFDQIEAYGDKDSPDYIADNKKREEAVKKFKADDKTGFVDDKRRIEAIEKDGEEHAEFWVEKGKIADEKPGFQSEEKLWLVDNPEVWKWALDKKLVGDNGSDWNVPAMRIEVKWRKEEAEYKAILDKNEGDEESKATKAYLAGEGLTGEALATRIEYRKDRRRREAYQLVPLKAIQFEEGRQPTEIKPEALKGLPINLTAIENELRDSVKVHATENEWDKQWTANYKEMADKVAAVTSGKGTVEDIALVIKLLQEDMRLDQEAARHFTEQGDDAKALIYKGAARKWDGFIQQLQSIPGGQKVIVPEPTMTLRPSLFAENYVDYYELPVKGYYRERYLLEKEEFASDMKTLKGTQFPNATKVPVAAYDALTEQYQDLFDKYDGYGDISKGRKPIEIKPEVLKGLPINLVAIENELRDSVKVHASRSEWDKKWEQNYVEIANRVAALEEGQATAEDLDFVLKLLREDKELDEASAKYFTEQGDDQKALIYEGAAKKWDGFIQQLQSVVSALPKKPTKKPISPTIFIEDIDERRAAREALLKEEPDFATARITREGYKNLIGQEAFVPQYVEYYTILAKGAPKDSKGDSLPWYEDDWYLMEHPDFYNKIYTYPGPLGNQKKNFSKVPTRAVYDKYMVYGSLVDRKGEPDRAARERFRRWNLALDAWLVLAKGYTPITKPALPAKPGKIRVGLR